MPEIGLDTAAVLRAWNAARDALRDLLLAKQAAPLERPEMGTEISAAVAAFETV